MGHYPFISLYLSRIEGRSPCVSACGVNGSGRRGRASIYGRDVTNQSYVTAFSTCLDMLVRHRGKPTVHRLSLSCKY
ncbi:hypothetical protein sphantq_03291 [Sphingobium sp. AntQ-1]|uniref:hypothetical protein n=1 Tax=Sphingobium TaxID=165695 RepID=UPI00234FAACE|nr:hypothetical protein [Sphingobium sp. AntQ-1]WCP14841.1 hypothetical protein sphantq_03291 [Sphingobium sp. AntQ-1]